ncbi:MAG: DHA2 family efflux MFS transporter permease subunit [Candidatus Dormibacteraeota bacterium]|nr:DHA2 family efflux MFS transporter permease subunit [Candidatus Dormibacteraeota bacterium]
MTQTARDNRSRWLALAVLCAGMLMIVLDATIVNVALPSIQRDLGFSESSLAWVVNAYLIPFGGLLLLAGRLGDLVGRKRVFITGLALFTAASFLCGVSGTQQMLIAARLVQGVGGAMTSTVILGVVVTTFTDPREQARAIGFFSFTAAAGGSVGLLAGGVLTQSVNWHWIFFVNLPIGVVAMVLAARLLESDRGIGLRRGADVPGALLVTSALILGVYTLVEASAFGWVSAHTLGFGGLSVLLLAGFVFRQLQAANPLLPLGLFRSRNVAGANGIQVLLVAGMFGMFFLGALYLQHVLGYDPLQIGLAFLPTAVVIGALSFRLSAMLNVRFGARPVLLAGLILTGAGLALFARVPVHAVYATDVLPSLVLIGTGVGLSFPALMTLAMSGATASDSGLVSGVVNTTAQVGASVGLALLATLATAQTGHLLASGVQPDLALTGGYRLAFLLAAALVAVAIVVAAVVLRADPPAAASEDGELAEFGEAA